MQWFRWPPALNILSPTLRDRGDNYLDARRVTEAISEKLGLFHFIDGVEATHAELLATDCADPDTTAAWSLLCQRNAILRHRLMQIKIETLS